MTTELKDVVTKLADKSAAAEKPGDAMQFAQAALNVAHALATLENIKR